MNESLGRGLSALIPDDLFADAPTPRGTPTLVPLAEIQPNPEQPREHFDPERLAELATSVGAHGVLSPLLVRPRDGGGYTLIAGERRLRAAGLAGLDEVPVVIRTDADDADVQLELALVENLQREDLDVVEAARGYQRLQQAFGYTQEEIATRVGKDRSTVANALRLLKLPEKVLVLLRDGRLSGGHAKALLSLTSAAQQVDVAARILAGDLSVRATEALVRQKKTKKKKTPDVALKRLSESLTRGLSTRVEVKGGRKKGRIVIDYGSADELERLVELLS
ncbi:MAG: ParB/RepB/Spo0J family partition protein [Proteobacteria bacterium]|nr:ParB/RepB/Spo0J family partition protein [Pseudomonadota bacterium]MCP4916324.1 ParB/RepB/Spo0J family partition protein [Pseudomonadota bacterium]